MSKPLPKFSPAQAEAWGRVLVWYREHGTKYESFEAWHGRYVLRGMTDDWVEGTDATFNALVRKGVLIRVLTNMALRRYAIHPDYLPKEDTQS